ncbi:histidine kinase [Flavobacterium amniphilum]|uniref:sensor histidine kinase n=1 Tax=Flavobacterium amniphilum TaxID=1834035 RepID=UPI00202AB263|nr:histidine kinase [Flavobacterium amniphilum]MCL9804442.1 histidine kinase [Flavobacterium amniphilum]
MRELPYEIKLTYIIAIAVMLLFVGFIIIVILIYNKRQLVQQQEIKIKESEFKNQLLEKELERQKSIQAERERISRDMHDDLGAGISAIKLQAEFMKFKLKDAGYSEDLEAIVKTSEEMNLAMREILWSLNSSNDTVGNFIDYVQTYTERFLEKTTISLKTEKSGIQSMVNLSVKVRRNLFLAIKEAVHNAYKHSEAKNLTILFTQTDNTLTIDITDDGKGLEKTPHNGNGLSNMKLRTKAIDGTFEVIPADTGTHLRFGYGFGEV